MPEMAKYNSKAAFLGAVSKKTGRKITGIELSQVYPDYEYPASAWDDYDVDEAAQALNGGIGQPHVSPAERAKQRRQKAFEDRLESKQISYLIQQARQKIGLPSRGIKFSSWPVLVGEIQAEIDKWAVHKTPSQVRAELKSHAEQLTSALEIDLKSNMGPAFWLLLGAAVPSQEFNIHPVYRIIRQWAAGYVTTHTAGDVKEAITVVFRQRPDGSLDQPLSYKLPIRDVVEWFNLEKATSNEFRTLQENLKTDQAHVQDRNLVLLTFLSSKESLSGTERRRLWNTLYPKWHFNSDDSMQKAIYRARKKQSGNKGRKRT
jgi:hypothetical protein